MIAAVVPQPPAIVIGPRPLSSVGRSALRFVTLGSEPRSIRAWRALFGRGAPPGTRTREPALQSRLHRPHLAGRPGPLQPLRPQLWRTSRPRFCPSCDGWASSCRSTRTGPTRTGKRSNSMVYERPLRRSINWLPACFGTTSPGSCYVSVPATSTVWLRTDVAEDTIDMTKAAAASTPPPAGRCGSERM